MFSPEPTTTDIPVDNPINLEAPATEAPISLDGPSVAKIPDEQTATVRAAKAHVAMGDQSPGIMDLRSQILSGNEDQLRQQMAVARDIADRQIRMDLVKSIAAQRAKEGKPLVQDDVSAIEALSSADLRNNPETILEKEYAHRYINNVANLRDGKNLIQDHAQKDPEGVALEMDVASNIKMRQETVKTRIEQLDTEWKDTSGVSKALDYAGSFVPLLESYRTHNVVAGSDASSILPGNNTDEQVQFLWSLPPQDFHRAFNAAVDELASKNPLMAMNFAHKVLEFSSTDKLLDNAFAIADVATLPGIGVAAKLGTKGAEAAASGLRDVKVALKDAVKAEASVKPQPIEEIVARSGDLQKAAEIQAYKDAHAKFASQDPLNQSGRLKAQVPTIFNIERVMEGSQGLSREASDRLSKSLEENAAGLMNALSDVTSIDRVPSQASIEFGLKAAEEKLRGMYPRLNDAVLDVRHISAESQATNVHEAEMVLGKSRNTVQTIKDEAETAIGKPDATLFAKKEEADYWAREIYGLNTGAYRVGTEQQGLGYYIGVRTPLNETEDGFRDLQLTTKHETPKGLMNTFLGLLRTPEDTLSTVNREARHVATHGAQELHRLAMGVAEDIGSLPKKSLQRLNRFLEANRDEVYEYAGKMRRGVFHTNVGEFDAAWSRFHGVSPTEKERLAYFSAVQLNDWDYVVRNLGLYRDKSRQGIEKFSFAHKITDETTGEAAMVKTNPIEGRIRKDIPWDDTEDANIYFYDGKTHNGKIVSKNGLTGDERTAISNAVNLDGYKIVQVANPVERPLAKIAGDDSVVHFMVVPDVDRSALDWKQLPYRPGGHVEYQFENWVKQPSVVKRGDKHVYEGDTSIFNFATEAEAKKFAKRMDEARVLLKDGKVDQLEGYLLKNLPYDLESFTKLFMEQQLKSGEKIPPRLTLSEPIRHTKSGRNVIDSHKDIEGMYENFDNQIRSTYNLYGQIDKKYASERDLQLPTVKERMGQDGPLFALEPSKTLDPLSTLNRAMANVMRSRYLSDYKHMSVENFIQEFGDLLKVEGGLSEIRKNPVYYLHNAPWDTQFPDKARLAAGKNAQRAIINLLGTESELGSNLNWAREQMMNSVYGTFGQKTSDFVAERMLPIMKDPFKYARNIAFHSKLGLFNPVQFFLQAQTLVHVSAVAGARNALPGMAAAGLMRMLTLTADKATVEHFAGMAGKFGWKKEDFLESYNALKKSGLWNVEGEVAFKDDIFDPKLFNGAAGKFLDKGTFFFREGERVTRLTAWNTAYREWKAANPTKVLDNKAIAEILTRQNTLSVNMTRASSAAWQQGIWSIPTQFFAYQARLAEQLLGKRLTQAEKARAFLTYSGMYGVPTAVGATTFAWPWYEDMRQSALERGIDLSPDSPFSRALMEGIPSTITAYLTGNEQNFSQRAGPGGVKYFKDVFKDGKVGEIFGASPKILYQMATAVAPVLKAAMSPFVPGLGDFKFTSADVLTSLEEISTLNNIGKAIYALNTHKFISKNEIDLGPATTADALMTVMMGTQPLAITDAFMMSDIQKERKAMQQSVSKEIVKNYRRALKEFNDGNDSAAQKYLNNAYLQLQGGDFRPDEQGKIFQEAIKGYESFVDKMNRDYINNSPASVYWQRIYKVFRVRPDGSKN